jgi:HD-like signal output (HDOD) protein
MADRVDTETLRTLPTLSRLPPWQFDVIAEFTETLTFKKGARLLERGSDDGNTYYLVGGKVALVGDDGHREMFEADPKHDPRLLANLRPRIVDVEAAGRATAFRIPDLLLDPVDCNGTTASDQAGPPSAELRLPFDLYRDLKNNEPGVLPSLPDSAVRIQIAIGDETSTAGSIARLLATDPAMAAKLIRIANSALYGGRTPVDTCTGAIVRLGLRTTSKLVLGFALSEVFRTRNQALRQRMKRLWDHSTDIAATCFVLAREVGGMDPEEALLAGLIHDVGAIAVLSSATRYPRLAANPERLERAIACLSGDVGAMILREWNFPPALAASARNAETWLRANHGKADLTDLVIVAQVHDRLHRKTIDQLPPIGQISAVSRVLGHDASPEKSVEIMNQAAHFAESLRSILRH